MTSFVADVLVTAGKLEKVDLNEKIADIQKEIAKLKNSVKDFIDENYIEFVPTLKKDQALVVKAEKLTEEMKSLEARVRDQIKIELSGSTRELKDLSNALKESSLSLRMSSQLLELSESLRLVETRKNEGKYVEAADALQRVHDILETQSGDLRSLTIYDAIRTEYANRYANFFNDLTCIWKKSLRWRLEKEDNEEIASLTIDCENDEIQELARGLRRVDSLEAPIANFAADLMNLMISPIVMYNETTIRVDDERILKVIYGDREKRPIYKSVLYYLRLLFQFLSEHLDLTIENGRTFVLLLRDHLLEPLSEILIQECIARTIPSSRAELQDFQQVVNDINEFQDYLLGIGFITQDQLFLSDYTRNVDNLIIEKICQAFLARAIAISRNDLHDSFRHEPEEPPKLLDEQTNDCEERIDRRLSKQTFHLPPCQISKSAREILKLAGEILDEACTSSEACATKLFYTSRNVFEIYTSTVLEYHKKFLETIPQQVALFHNNCMYLAHHLLSLAYEYKDRLPNHLQKHNVTYADLTSVMRIVGSEYFLDHMKYQRKIILGILRDSGLPDLGQWRELPPNTERALRQCIRQLELLKTVWMDVLPINIYCRAVGCIANSMVEVLVTEVITVEDIPADVATKLAALFDMIVQRTPSIFPVPDTVQRYVIKWSKLAELIRVLKASLKEIEDRWADGKGPLANEFTPSQVKQLIRALFQNTERRSNLLAIIK